MANGQILPISQYSALFSLFGTMYGGDGETTLGLPDLRGRSPIGHGAGPGLSHTPIAAKGGSETQTLGVNNIPAHNHTLQGVEELGNQRSPDGAALAAQENGGRIYRGGATANKPLVSTSIANTGGGQAFDIRSPYLAITYVVATVGIYPSRN